MQWLNEPASWQRTGDVLRVSVDPGTDFWRTTGYGYVHDNGHVYGDLLPGDLDISVRVRGAFTNQYDQAGIMLRADEQTWLKTGLEFFEGRPRLSTVLTMGCSSWMVADLPPGTDEVTLRVSRRGDAVEVRYAAGDGAAELAALVFMPPGREMLAGIVCAAPEGSGFSVAFHDLRIAGREWGGQEAADDAGWAQEEAAATGAGWNGGSESWGGERADDGAPRWAADGPGEAAPGWGRDKPEEAAPRWAGKKADDGAPGWAVDKPGVLAPGRAKETAGVPAGGDGEPAENESVDWAKPQASEPAEDWDRLSLSVSGTGSWNAFAAARPARQQQKPEEAAEQKAAEPATDQAAGRAGRGGDGGAGEPPRSPVGGQAEPALAAAGPPLAAAKPNGRNGRGRNKAKQSTPGPSARPAPTDAADEWISLLTADSADELSAPGTDGLRSTPGPRLPGPCLPGPRLPGPRLPGRG